MPEPDDSLAHEGPIQLGQATNLDAPAGLGLPKTNFVRYPGSQQLQLWLPLPGRDGYGELRVVGADGGVIDRASVAQRLNGPVQLLWDTLAWPPGAYTLEIDHADGWRHVLPLHKLPDTETAMTTAPLTQPKEQTRCDADLLLRAQLAERLRARLSRRVMYEGNYRAGAFTYIDGPLRIRFGQEMGGGDCLAVLDVPPAHTWEALTGIPLAQRDEIVRFIAEQVTREFGSRFEIGAESITIY